MEHHDDDTPPARWFRLPDQPQANCPFCGKAVRWVPSDTETGFYECEKHGVFVLPPERRMREAS